MASSAASSASSVPPPPATTGLGSTSAIPPPPPLSSSGDGVVLSAAANLYPEKVLEAKRAAEKQDENAPKKKKLKAKRELEAGKSKWMEFNSKSKFAKSHKKDSMFRTPEGIHGRGK